MKAIYIQYYIWALFMLVCPSAVANGLPSLMGNAAEPSSDDHDFGYTRQPDTSTAETSPVIASNGTSDVSQTGAAVYSYAIALPPGVGGMQPNVSVAYNSQGGNGIAGWGCNISGLSAITRGQKTVFHDGTAKGVTYANDDAYYLDGVRLMLISGSAGCDGAIYSPENAPSTKVIFHDGGLLTTWIEVKTADGKTYIYGDTSDSKQLAVNGIGREVISTWYITKVEDRHGNYIGYSYMSDNCMVYPQEIFYGGNTRKNTGIYNSIRFEYESRTDQEEYLVSSRKVVMALRLRSIESATNGSRYRYYTLQYKSGDQSGKTFSRLYSITEQNSDGEERPPVVLKWKSLPAFSQQVLSPDISLVRSSSFSDGYTTVETKIENEIFMACDMTGDGLAEIIELASSTTTQTWPGGNSKKSTTPLYIYKASHTNGVLSYTRAETFDLGFNGAIPVLGLECNKLASYQLDFDGDGFADICIPQSMDVSGYPGKRIVFSLIRGGNFSHNQFGHELKGEDKNPCFTTADVDHDGRSEVIVLEKSPYGGGYICGLFGYKDESSIRHHEQILKLSYPPVHIFTGDFNNDGLVDLMVIETIRYKIYFNNGGKFEDGNMFSESNTRIGATLFGGDRVFQGDFNGDGLVDFLTNDSGYKNWYFCLNKGNGDFTKRLACTSDIYKHANGRDNDKMQCLVFDFDFDGKSDVVMTNYVSESVPSKTVWMRSTGESLYTVKEVVSGSEANSLASRFAVGCFTGSGQMELMNYGANCYSQDGQTEPQIHIYTNDGYTPESGKVTSITDETGRTVDITYASLTDGNTYAMGYGTSYPVIGSTLPLHVVSGIKTDNGIAGDTELKYGYRGMRTHVTGRGFLGFTSVTARNSVTGDETETTIDSWDTSCFAPSKTTVRKTSAGYTETTTATNTYSVNADKTFALQKTAATTVNSDRIRTTVRNTYDPQRGCLLSERKEGEYSENYHEAIYSDFTERAGMYLPQTVTYKDNYYDASNPVTRKTRITYDELGNKTSECINDGTSLPVTKGYGYDVYGNVISETTCGEGVERMQSVNEYEPSGRFVMKKYTVPASAASFYFYDQWGHPITEVDVTNPEDMLYTEYTYNSWGQAETVISPSCVHSKTVRGWGNDNSKRYYVLQFADGEPWVKTWYDSMGREVLVESVGMKDIDVSVKTEYDIYGRPIQVTSHTGDLCVTKTTAYDSSGHVASETSSNGGTVNYSYDGRQITIDDNGREYRKYYDDGGVLLSSTDMSGEIGYEYNSFYKPVKVRMLSDNSIVGIGYDDVGNRISLTDPDAGRTTYSHDALGRVRTRTDARGHKTSYTFDAAGRQTQISGNDTVFAEYTYGTTGNGAQQLVKEESGDAYTTYSYDEYGWLSSKTRHIDGKNLVYRYTYNSLGQTTRIVYPGGVTADYTYDCYGNRTSIAVGGKTVWRMDGYTGKSYTSSFGSLLTEDVELDDCGRKTSYVLKKSGRLGSYTELYRTSYEYDKPTGNLIKKTTARDGLTGVLPKEEIDKPVIDLGDFVGNALSSDGIQPAHPRPEISSELLWLCRTETYSYDSSDRLIQVDRNNSVYQTMAYDVNGNILSKTDVGTYNYDTVKRHAVTSIDVTAGKYSPGEQTVTYNFLGKVETIGEWNGDKYHELNITYGPDMERCKSVLTTNHEEKRTVIYSDSYECVTENGQTREFYYIGENVILVRQTGKSDMVCHAVTDNQGSILCIVDDDGRRLFEAAYDAWGKQERITDTIGFLRGYTGHEMLPEFGLINMNGRVYDPMLGRFLSPDNYVQMPDNTQSFNRYSYCINNPLKYVDPSGEFWWIVAAAAVIGGGINVVANIDNIDSFGQFASYFGIGALGGATGALIYPVVAPIVAGGISGGIATGLVSGSLTGAITGGGNAVIGGGSFNEIIEGTFMGAFWGGLSGAAINGIIGGIVSYSNGENIWNGRPLASKTAIFDNLDIAPEYEYINLKVSNTQNGLTSYEKGQQGVERAMHEFVEEGGTVLKTEVSVRVNDVTYRVDFVGEKNGMLYLYEVKNGPSAGFTINQKIVIPQILENSPQFVPFGGNANKIENFKNIIPFRNPYPDEYRFVLKHYF